MSEFPYEEAAMAYYPEDSAAGNASSPVAQVKQIHESSLMAIEGVEGVGIGRNRIGEDVILVYLRGEEVKSRVPKSVDGVEVETHVTGIIDAY